MLLQEPGCLPQSFGAGEGGRKEHIAINTHVQNLEQSSSSHGYEVVTDSLERWTIKRVQKEGHGPEVRPMMGMQSLLKLWESQARL